MMQESPSESNSIPFTVVQAFAGIIKSVDCRARDQVPNEMRLMLEPICRASCMCLAEDPVKTRDTILPWILE